MQQSIHRYFELSLFAMIVVGFVALAGTGRLDFPSLMFVLIALGTRSYLLATGRSWNLSVQATSRLTLVYIVFYIADLFLISRSFVTTLVHLVLFIMVVKIFSIQRDRDYVYLAIISFMMVLAAAVLTVDSFFLGVFLVFMLLSIATFISMEMRRSIRDVRERAAANAAARDHAPLAHVDSGGRQSASVGTVDPATFSTRRMGRSLSVTAAVLVFSIFAGVPLIFYTMPRWSFGRLSRFSAQNVFVSGFSDNVKLGEIGRIQQSDAVVMRVQFQEGSAPIPAGLKWAGVTLSNFDGFRWSNHRVLAQSQAMSAGADFRLELNSPRTLIPLTGDSTALRSRTNELLVYRVMMEPIGTNAFFLVRTPLVLIGEARAYAVDGAGTIGYMDSMRQIRSYQGISLQRRVDDSSRRSPIVEPPASLSQFYLQMPETDPRTRALANEITANADSAYDKAAAIENYLRTRFGYTLEMQGAGKDPVGHFLFVWKRGHCEYFASAMAVMLRSIGIPSRIVNGFRNGEFNDVSGSYVIRARDAHSWVEAYLPGHGWTEFDPTPAAASPEHTSWSRVLLYVDAMREFWNEWIINYDAQRQTQLGDYTASNVRAWFDTLRMKLRDQYDALLERIRQTQTQAAREPRRLGIQVLLVILAIVVAINLRRLWSWLRTRRIRRSPSSRPSEAASIWYQRLLKLLQRRGMEKRPAQTPQEFVRSLPEDVPFLRDRVDLFTDRYERARFGRSAEDAEQLPRLFDEVEEALKR